MSIRSTKYEILKRETEITGCDICALVQTQIYTRAHNHTYWTISVISSHLFIPINIKFQICLAGSTYIGTIAGAREIAQLLPQVFCKRIIYWHLLLKICASCLHEIKIVPTLCYDYSKSSSNDSSAIPERQRSVRKNMRYVLF